MKGSNIILPIQHLKIAKEFYQDFQRANPGTKGARLFKIYEEKIEWIYRDMISNPNFDETVIQGIKDEWSSDAFVVPAITEKIAVLRPDQRSQVEEVIDLILKGEPVDISLKA